MDFFESQELARRKTKWLIVLFILAVLAIIASIYAIVVLALSLASEASGERLTQIATDGRLIVGVIVAVTLVIILGITGKMFELRSGGSAVASMMGGRRVVGNAKTLTDRRIMNVVEEMALASGTPVPPVYILDNEPGINAFAAGYTIDDAIIAINRGTAENLTREELQGVVAHEFSHILNGDMRMNLRLLSVLNGILLISLIGGTMLHVLSRSGHAHRRSGNDKNQGGHVILLVIAAGLYAIGSIGLFFGRMIKSTISRQREYLADASAVQFTRAPDGIANALKMIGGTSTGSKIQTPNAEQISHMFFGPAKMNLLFATHPPLLKRIQQVDHRFDGDFKNFMAERQQRLQLLADQEQPEESPRAKTISDFLPGSGRIETLQKFRLPIDPLMLIAGIGIPTNEDMEFSQLLKSEIPEPVLEAIRDTFSARCVVFAALLDQDDVMAQQQLAMIRKTEAPGTMEMTIKLRRLLLPMPLYLRLPMFEIIQGTLSAMSPAQYPVFRQTLLDLIHADNRVDLFEFFLRHHLIVHLDRNFLPQRGEPDIYRQLGPIRTEVSQMLSVLACVGQRQLTDQREVFRAAIASLFPAEEKLDDLFVTQWDHVRLAEALQTVARATPAIKKKVLSAAALAISYDRELTVQEVELFRAMAESLDCPVPPLVATRDNVPSLPDPQDLPS